MNPRLGTRRSVASGIKHPTIEVTNSVAHLSTEICRLVYFEAPPWQLRGSFVDMELYNRIKGVENPLFVSMLSREYISERYGDHTAIYTDGYRTPTGTGWAVHIPSRHISISQCCQNHLSSYFVEILAIRAALSWILENGNSSAKYVILTDFMSAIKSFHPKRGFCAVEQTTKEIFVLLHKLQIKDTATTLAWLPGHMDVPGNEEADRLARLAADNSPVSRGNNTVAFLSLREAKSVLRKRCLDEWEHEYTMGEKGAHFKQFQDSVKTVLPSPTNHTSNSILFRLRTGHCKLNAHLFKIGCVLSPNCESCPCPETVEHFILYCLKYRKQRAILFRSCFSNHLSPTLINVLTHPNMARPVIDFALGCKRPL